jgi:hypothetical protein
MPDSYFGTFEDLSDPEARQDAEADAREESLLTADPPHEDDGALAPCGACGGLGGRCCDVSAMEVSR